MLRFVPVSGLLALLLASPAAGQQRPLELDLDHACFAYDDDTSLFEVYLAFNAMSLDFEQGDDAMLSLLPIDFVLQPDSDVDLEGTPTDPVWADSLTLRFAVVDTSALQPGQQFVHQIRTAVPPGEYELSVVIPKDDAGRRPPLELKRDVIVGDFTQTGQVRISDVTLASMIQRSEDRNEPFYRNGLLVQPNPNLLFGQGLPNVFYYLETYGAESVADAGGDYTVLAFISEANRSGPIATLQNRQQRRAASPDIVVGSFDISGLASGSYFLRVVVLDRNNESVVEQSRKLFVYNPNVIREEVVPLEITFENSEYATLPEEEVENIINQLEPIATDQERRRERQIRDLDERRRFIMEFWKVRDPSPGSIENEFKSDYQSRIEYANDRYSSAYSEGWKTDRGLVLLKYGLPTGIEPHLYDRNRLPHEIWEYNNISGVGRAVFVFADRTSFGEFELIHSTVPGERQLPNWEQELVR